MAKRKVIWSNTAIKKLYAIFESDIRKGNSKEHSANLFKTISKQIRPLTKFPEIGVVTSDSSIRGLITRSIIVFYSFSDERVFIHTIGEYRVI